ncbi:hypothetical protein [Pseudomonas sp. dw_358]|uniref:hypothetical protein n=1 Tax=Pseudomonas sp. dw_358 TaxID=2720083 RepID=UPI001BD52038|nr:hypothetical protein [Pseudomonas sp. dw_358]
MKPWLYTAIFLACVQSAHVMAAGKSFHGTPCKNDEECSSLAGGYEWAKSEKLTDKSSCNTPTATFNQGCQIFIKENAGKPQPPDGNEDDDDGDEED